MFKILDYKIFANKCVLENSLTILVSEMLLFEFHSVSLSRAFGIPKSHNEYGIVSTSVDNTVIMCLLGCCVSHYLTMYGS